KRDFRQTPEPRGRVAKRGGKLRFVIQKHAASHLHYDFRLELSGVLKSWAVPKGPSLDPGDKRLAVMVEDHPLEYGGFEGTIPKGQYGGGTVLLWDRGTWEPRGDAEAGLRKGHLAFTLHGKKLQGAFSLVRMGQEAKNWLLMKTQDEFARSGRSKSVVQERPESVASGKSIEEIAGAPRAKVWNSNRGASKTRTNKPTRARRASGLDPSKLLHARKAAMPRDARPQFATLVPEAPEGDDWLHEIKYDGYRVLARIDRGRARLITRGGLDWTDRFTVVADALQLLPVKQAILDGEIAMVLEDGTTSFQALQNQLRSGNDEALAYFVFDLLYQDGWDLTQAPLEQRKEALSALIDGAGAGSVLRYSDHLEGQGARFHREACRSGLEGIVSKRKSSVYTPGRTGSWLKTKCSSRQEFVIGGYTEPQGAREGIGSLLLGTNENGDGLRYRGRVGTGFTRETLDELLQKLRPLEIDKAPFADRPPQKKGVHWVRPQLVAEVSFGSWTNDGRLRHPSFQGLREDKPADEVVREAPRNGSTPATPRRASARTAAPAKTKRRPTPERRRPPDTPPRIPPPVKEPGRRPPVADPPPRPRKRPMRDPVDTDAALAAITSPERVLYADEGITKLDLARYYRAVAPHLLAHAAGRPLMLRRCPEGIDGPCFIQKHPGQGTPVGMDSVRVRERMKTERHLVLRDEAGLLSLAQVGVLEIHVWGALAESLERPDRVVFDFDPAPESSWKDVVLGARRIRERIEALGLECFVKTSGGKGVHVVVPTRPGPTWDDVKDFSAALAAALTREEPDRFTTHLAKARRGGRIFIDTLRNRRGATWVAPYSPRARRGAPVSMPISWEELTAALRPGTFSIPRLLDRRGAARADAWDGMARVRQTITRTILREAAIAR
ncbi:MAG TPA: DNA ligase D, partial [Candidatus Eisenbacteria bacterium]|nr:DNA ligase D [Candidatus Eisenbacteria bacterium]